MGLGLKDKDKRWKDHTVAYVIDHASFPNPSSSRSTVMRAIEEWNSVNKLRFVPRFRQRTYVKFVAANGSCSTKAGRQGGVQEIGCDLNSPGFGKGSILHEMGHAVGLCHEHTRNDRDQWVKIDFSNVKSNKKSQYKKRDDAKDFGKYDYGSIMHYPERGNFAIDASKDVILVPDNVSIGQRAKLSSGDIDTLTQMYGHTTVPLDKSDCGQEWSYLSLLL